MGLLKKKSSKEFSIGEPSALLKLSDMDLYIHVETTLMDSAQLLSRFRSSTNEDREGILVWLFEALEAQRLGYEEFARRLQH